jgi:hypothetical protein
MPNSFTANVKPTVTQMLALALDHQLDDGPVYAPGDCGFGRRVEAPAGDGRGEQNGGHRMMLADQWVALRR